MIYAVLHKKTQAKSQFLKDYLWIQCLNEEMIYCIILSQRSVQLGRALKRYAELNIK